MASKFISAVTDPFIAYFQATIGASCEILFPPKEKPRNSKKNKAPQRYGKRERKQSFSFMRCVQRQREMTSPTRRGGMVSVESVREHYLRDSWSSDDSSPFVH